MSHIAFENLQAKLSGVVVGDDAFADTIAGLSPSYDKPPASWESSKDIVPLLSKKRDLDRTSKVDPLHTKRVLQSRTDVPIAGVEDEARQVTKVQLPKPNFSKRPYATCLGPRVERLEQVSPNTQKSRVGSDNNSIICPLEPAPLTRANLALFDKMAGNKESKAMASVPSESIALPSTTKTISTTISGFAIKTRDNGILDPLRSKPPTNLEDIRKRLARSRETPTPPESRYNQYVNTVGVIPNEATMVVEVSRHMLKEYDDEGYHQVFNQAFTNFPKDAGFNNGLSNPQPDFVEGLERDKFCPFPVDKLVAGAVLYQDNPYSMTLPHLAGEWKGRGRNMDQARLQSAYDGAALVYARNQALSHLGNADPPGHAEVTTFTTDGTTLNLFAHYAALSEDGTLEYHQYPVTSVYLLNSHQEYIEGRRRLRNGQDYARYQAYALRDQLKMHWGQLRDAQQPVIEAAPPFVLCEDPPDTAKEYRDSSNKEGDCLQRKVEGAPLPPKCDGEQLSSANIYKGGEDETCYKVVAEACESTPPTSSNLERLSKHDTSNNWSPSSKSLAPGSDDCSGGSAQKREASLSDESFPHKPKKQRI